MNNSDDEGSLAPLKGDLVELRPTIATDTAFILNLCKNPEMEENVLTGYPTTPENIAKEFIDDESGKFFIVKDLLSPEKERIGLAGLTLFFLGSEKRAQTAEITVVIKKEFGNKGRGKEAIKLLIKHAFEAIGVNSVFSTIFDCNQASKEAHKSVGFKKCGTLPKAIEINGKTKNISWFGINREEFNKKTASPH